MFCEFALSVAATDTQNHFNFLWFSLHFAPHTEVYFKPHFRESSKSVRPKHAWDHWFSCCFPHIFLPILRSTLRSIFASPPKSCGPNTPEIIDFLTVFLTFLPHAEIYFKSIICEFTSTITPIGSRNHRFSCGFPYVLLPILRSTLSQCSASTPQPSLPLAPGNSWFFNCNDNV